MAKRYGNWCSKTKRIAITVLRDNLRCAYCNKDLSASPEEVTLDHLIPVFFGGSNSIENLITCCRRCNCSRQEKSLDEWNGCNGWAKRRVLKQIAKPVDYKLARQYRQKAAQAA